MLLFVIRVRNCQKYQTIFEFTSTVVRISILKYYIIYIFFFLEIDLAFIQKLFYTKSFITCWNIAAHDKIDSVIIHYDVDKIVYFSIIPAIKDLHFIESRPTAASHRLLLMSWWHFFDQVTNIIFLLHFTFIPYYYCMIFRFSIKIQQIPII